MRVRFIVSTLIVSIVAVLLFGVPLAVVVNRLILDQARQRLQRDADQIAASAQIHAERGERVTRPDLVRTYPHRYVVVKYPGHATVRAGRAPENRIQARSHTPDGALVVVSSDRNAVDDQIARAMVLVAGLGVVAIGVAVGLAIVQSRRLTWPLTDLAERADRLGSGEALPRGRRYGIAELDRVASVLDNSAARLGELLAAEREFATNASHQLRTPLAALSMRLEEIAATARSPEVVEEEAQAALAQVERLTQVVDHLLAAARTGAERVIAPISIDDIVDQQVAEWEPAFRRSGRALAFAGSRGLSARASAGGLGQVIATLLDNALVHGAGTATVRASATSQSVVVEVSDEGEGVPPGIAPEIFHRHVSGADGTGLGLALARTLAEADGGRLELVADRPARFAVFLLPVRGD
ncbi:MAG: ATP-binding protein [Streptosporangiales bacterium]